ncbi:MAG TPA: hypothetical protein VFH51_13960 [Myxococcota bacterium]|nr:hypothetical protein [Myxococcota bacterium]
MTPLRLGQLALGAPASVDTSVERRVPQAGKARIPAEQGRTSVRRGPPKATASLVLAAPTPGGRSWAEAAAPFSGPAPAGLPVLDPEILACRSVDLRRYWLGIPAAPGRLDAPREPLRPLLSDLVPIVQARLQAEFGVPFVATVRGSGAWFLAGVVHEIGDWDLAFFPAARLDVSLEALGARVHAVATASFAALFSLSPDAAALPERFVRAIGYDADPDRAAVWRAGAFHHADLAVFAGPQDRANAPNLASIGHFRPVLTCKEPSYVISGTLRRATSP